MASPEFVDPYINPKTGILRNSVGAKTWQELHRIETDMGIVRLVGFRRSMIPATADLDELCSIHHLLFQDIYEWAGMLRVVDLRKNGENAVPFLPVSMIPRASMFAAEQLREDLHLAGLDFDTFIDKLAFHYDQFNYIHPFREGNGRTQRLFWNRIAQDAGWLLEWKQVTSTINDTASRVARETGDLSLLKDMFTHVVSPLPPDWETNGERMSPQLTRISFAPAQNAARASSRPSMQYEKHPRRRQRRRGLEL
ncbi:Fic family protein [Schaalia sp. ZJ1691]|uniref:Fic/DOC family protein n=1 Tax=Schaalia sp. ZJ1691 TaxID=2709404 RepID=UPI0013EA8DB4|nr:Fic family protein [Schaalia sp. ZJ1691]